MKTLLPICIVIVLLCNRVFAQESEKDSVDLGDVFKSVLGIDQPRLGLNAQFDAEMHKSSSEMFSSFNVHLLRLFLSGAFDKKFNYVVQFDVNGWFSLLDLKLSYKINDHFKIDAGQFKAPYGREYLKNDALLTFVNRSTVAQTLSLQRQRGVQLVATTDRKTFSIVGGIFNGRYSYSDNKISMLAGRISYVPIDEKYSSSKFRVDLGGSAAYTTDYQDLADFDYFDRHKLLYSSNFRIDYDILWIEAEYNYLALMDVRSRWADGVCADLGCRINAQLEIAGRFDWLQMNRRYSSLPFLAEQRIARKYLLGFNWHPYKDVKLQFDYEYDQPNKIHSGYINFQYAINYEH